MHHAKCNVQSATCKVKRATTIIFSAKKKYTQCDMPLLCTSQAQVAAASCWTFICKRGHTPRPTRVQRCTAPQPPRQTAA
jgi:hypothetical protein